MNKVPYIVTSILVVLAGIFAILNTYWTGFAYFVMTCFLFLTLFWGGWQIYKYFTSYQKELEERFKIYKAQKLISANISVEVFDASEKSYRKDFHKKLRREKFVKWFVIAFCFAVAAAFVAGMILY